MICKKCKMEIPDQSVYCMFCGAACRRDRRKKLYQRPDGLYESIRTISGKRVIFRGRTEDEVYLKILSYTPPSPTFSDLASIWHDHHWKTISYNSTLCYNPAYQRAVDHFGAFQVTQIKPKDIQSFLFDFSAGHAMKTVKTQLLILNLFFTWCVVNGYVDSNPAQSVSVPKGLPHTSREMPSDDVLIKIESSVLIPFGLFPYFLLYTGCRLGEALAIQQKDIDRKNNLISITKSVYWVSNVPHVKEPKTASGVRQVPLLPQLQAILPSGPSDSYLFSVNGSDPLKKSEYQKKWHDYLKLSGISVTPHQLRHAYATILYDAGVDRLDAQHLLGHSDSSVTEKIYTHIRESHKQKVFKNIENFHVVFGISDSNNAV